MLPIHIQGGGNGVGVSGEQQVVHGTGIDLLHGILSHLEAEDWTSHGRTRSSPA